MILLLAIATMVGCFGYLAAEYLEQRLAGCLLKTFASSAFVALAAFAGAADTTFGQVLFAGFILSFIGDVLLLWHATFLAGLGSFLLGHFAFALGAVTFLTKPGALAYVVMSAQEWPSIDKGLREAKFHLSSTIIWVKDALVLSRKDYHTQYELLWYGWNEDGPRIMQVPDRKQSDIWNIARPRVSDLHPTTKPTLLIERALLNSSATLARP